MPTNPTAYYLFIHRAKGRLRGYIASIKHKSNEDIHCHKTPYVHKETSLSFSFSYTLVHLTMFVLTKDKTNLLLQ